THLQLHKLFLCRDPQSMFRNMFDDAGRKNADVNGIETSESGEGDLEHIPMDDSAEEFRAMCWALYALPTETQVQNLPGANIQRLVHVANMSHKYTLASFEDWALNIIWIHCQPGMDYLNTCSVGMLRRIFEAATKGGRTDLRDLVEQRWLPRLKTGELELRDALDFGEMHGRREFSRDGLFSTGVGYAPVLSVDQGVSRDGLFEDWPHARAAVSSAHGLLLHLNVLDGVEPFRTSAGRL
ncbi:hypothetical protein FB45DRAFT_737452, partial [Roridomyces roridus]